MTPQRAGANDTPTELRVVKTRTIPYPQKRLTRILAGVATPVLLAAFMAPARAYTRPGDTELISVKLPPGPPNLLGDGNSGAPSISATGRYVAFSSTSSRLVQEDTNLSSDVFVRDRLRRRTVRVSVSSDGSQGIGSPTCGSHSPSISATGRYVAFWSGATNLVPDDTNAAVDVFVHDLKNRTTERVSLSSAGKQHNDSPLTCGLQRPAINGNGRFIAFTSAATNLVENDTNAVGEVFLHDRKTEKTTRVSVASNGDQGNSFSSNPSLDAEGRFVAFTSFASNLVADDLNLTSDAFVRDRKTRKTLIVSVGSDGTRSGLGPFEGSSAGVWAMSPDGRYVGFTSDADNLVPNDTNESFDPCYAGDAFTHDLKTGRTERVSVTSRGQEAEGGNGSAAFGISAGGRFVVLRTHEAFAPDDTADKSPHPFGCDPNRDVTVDVYIYDRLSGEMELASRNQTGEPVQECGLFDSLPGSVSANGRYVPFNTCAPNFEGHNSDQSSSDVYVRDRGRLRGVGTLTTGGNNRVLSTNASTAGVTRVSDSHRDALGLAGQGAEIIGATLAYRPRFEDLFVKIDVDHMPGPRGGVGGLPAAGNPAIVYGLKFKANGTPYEVRVAKTGPSIGSPGEAVFGLFRCDSACAEVARLKGGYGTVGENVVTAVPREALGLEDNVSLQDVTAFSSLGAYRTGGTTVLDEVDLSK